MKNFSDDVFAVSNPAFCALILHFFLKGYFEPKEKGADYPIAFLPIPLLLSNDIMSTMRSTNKSTGFLNWITGNPIVKVNLHERIQNTLDITKDAILFGAQKGLFEITNSGQFVPISQIKDTKVKKQGLYHYTSISERFGFWSGSLDSTETLLYSLGITI